MIYSIMLGNGEYILVLTSFLHVASDVVTQMYSAGVADAADVADVADVAGVAGDYVVAGVARNEALLVSYWETLCNNIESNSDDVIAR